MIVLVSAVFHPLADSHRDSVCSTRTVIPPNLTAGDIGVETEVLCWHGRVGALA